MKRKESIVLTNLSNKTSADQDGQEGKNQKKLVTSKENSIPL